MTPARRPKVHRLGRDRREVLIAVLCAVAVVAVTAVLLWVLAPANDDPPPSTTPISLPQSAPATSVPDTGVPDTGVPDTVAPEPSPTTAPGG